MTNLQDIVNKIHCSDNLPFLKTLPNNSIDLLVTDPPYGYSFMNKDWDKSVPPISVWKECLRILKPGAFAFIMSSPRQDVLAQMIFRISQAGFKTDFTSIYWAHSSGFPKSMNIGKAIDKQMGAKREITGINKNFVNKNKANTEKGQSNLNKNRQILGLTDSQAGYQHPENIGIITAPSSPEAKTLDGSYAGFQPKPAVEIIIVAMRPLSEKTYVEQALKNGKGITWLDNGRIPFQNNDDKNNANIGFKYFGSRNSLDLCNQKDMPREEYNLNKGRFPANLLVQDDILNDGKKHSAGDLTGQHGTIGNVYGVYNRSAELYLKGNPVDSFSRYFSLDAWFEENLKKLPPEIQKVFPFLIVPKASGSEKEEGLDNLDDKPIPYSEYRENVADTKSYVSTYSDGTPRPMNKHKNFHPTVKPIKLFSYLITLGSRDNDIILDPYIGSGTSAISALMLGRKFIGIDNNEDYCKIANERIKMLLNYSEMSEIFSNSVSDEISKPIIIIKEEEEDMFA